MMTLVLAVGATAFALKALNNSNPQIEREKITNQALAAAKSAVIGWSVSHETSPGSMPFPDRNGDGDYDGNSDCSTGAFSYSLLLGQLPWKGQTAPCTTPYTGFGIDIRDGYGNRLWYAVSRNLVRDYQNSAEPVINPGMITGANAATAPYQRLGGTTAYPWLRVFNKNGQLLSDRVAVVIIAPGPAIGAQDRSAATPAAAEYLDSFSFAAGGGIKSNTSYTSYDEDFYMGEDSRNIDDTDTTYTHPYDFNDKLVYITIDELLAEVEKRATAEAKAALKNYQTTNSFFPYAAPLANPVTHACKASLTSGLLPTSTSANTSCSCSSNVNCTCAFSKISNVQYIRTSTTATWTSNTGSCSRSGNICTCTGTGSCTRTTRTFSCNGTTGVCSLSGSASGQIVFNGVFTNPPESAITTSGSCSITTSPACGSKSVTCTGSGTFSYTQTCTDPVLSGLPSWFTTNSWQDYFYYSISRSTPTLSLALNNVTTKTGITALLIASSYPITSSPFTNKNSAQSRPSCNVNDFLDSAENTNGDDIYDAITLPKSTSYNDRTFIVAP